MMSGCNESAMLLPKSSTTSTVMWIKKHPIKKVIAQLRSRRRLRSWKKLKPEARKSYCRNDGGPESPCCVFQVRACSTRPQRQWSLIWLSDRESALGLSKLMHYRCPASSVGTYKVLP